GGGLGRGRLQRSIPMTDAPIRINSTDFLAAQRANRRKTIWLILVLLLLGGGLGYVLGWAGETYAQSRFEYVDLLRLSVPGLVGGLILLGIGVGATAVTFAAGDKVVLALNNAREVSAGEEPLLHNVVEEMAIAAGLPKPRVAIIESDAMNAFAAGMYPHSAAIGVTRGLLANLSREELQGVIAHEMGHILNWDTRYMTAVGILVGLVALVCDAVLRARWHRGVGSSGGGKSKGGGAALVLMVVLIFAILAPIAGRLVQFAVSRQREYLADATSVQLTRSPLGLIGALQKLGHQPKAAELGNRATQHLFIVNPIREFGATASALMATHPDIESRIQRLQNLGA
ncbi:MAG: M48 family metallopeptidase, partial [Dongiaceae bacterium]